jgi:RHS repeat-associated protein
VARSETGNNVVYIHAGQQVIADYARGAAAAAPSFRYVYGSYVDEPLLRHAGTGTTLPTSGTAALYYHRNQQYSIVGLSDAAGALVERYAYTAYGELTILAPDRTLRPTSSFQNRYTYTGREWDPTLRLYYFRARWLEPKAGRFIGRDPLGYVDGMSLYGAYFVPRNLDPFGMHVCHCFGNHGVGGIPNWNAKENKYFFISDEKNEDEATLECEENCRRYATSRPLTTWAFKIITDNRGQGLGQFHYTFHGLLLEFSPVSSPEAKSSLLDELYQDLKTFRHFNDGFNVDGSVEFGPDGRLAYFDALSDGPELPPFGVLSDFINDNYTPVALEFDDTNRTVTGRTLPGHMLEGKRTWTVEEPRAGNNNEVLSAGCRFVVLVRTVAVERKVGLANDLGAKFAGTKLQMRVWDSYLKNIAKYYTSPKRQPRAKVIARTSNERQAAPNEYPW